MRRWLTLIVVGIICTVFVACQSGQAGLSDMDKAAIHKVVEDATKIQTSAKPDYAAYVKLYYAETATVLMPNMPPVQGRAAIQAVLASFPPTPVFKIDIVDVDGRGDLAYVRGNYSMTMNPPGAPPVSDTGKYVEVWKKQADGAWTAIYDSWSSDLPAPGLTVPTGAMAADATPELKKLADIVGRWQFDGMMKADPKAPAGPVVITFSCDWFAGGRQVVYRFSGTMAGTPWEEFGVYSHDTATKAFAYYGIVNDGTAAPGKLAIEPGTWIHTQDIQIDKKPAKTRFTLSNMSPAGGAWKYEMSTAGGPWTVLGDGKYAKAK